MVGPFKFSWPNTPKVGVYKLPNSKGITNAARNSCLYLGP